MTPLRSARGFVTDNPGTDVAFAGLAVAAYWWWEVRDASDAVARLDADAYRVAVTALSGMAAALLGLAITAMAIVLAVTPGDRLRVLLRHHRATIVRSFVAAARALGLLVGVTVYLLLFRPDGDVHEAVRVLLYLVLVLSGLGLARLVYVLNHLLRIGTIDKDERTEGNGPRPVGRQFRDVS